jgi:lipopolysaccharide/colanic/teichoic acid biosynthesis glycosyltransferase
MYILLKRLLDLSIAVCLLLVLSPLLLFVSIWIWAYDRGSILYRAPRVGRKGKGFTMFKFRTMVLNADKIGASSTADDDPRITPIGRFLRKYKFDELPQLFNVLNGTMSLVGPRPQVKWAVDLYTEQERAVLEVAPGITDYASVFFPNEGEILKGSLDPDRDYMEKIHPIKMKLCLRYVQERSLSTDIKIIVLTALAVAGLRRLAPQLDPTT